MIEIYRKVKGFEIKAVEENSHQMCYLGLNLRGLKFKEISILHADVLSLGKDRIMMSFFYCDEQHELFNVLLNDKLFRFYGYENEVHVAECSIYEAKEEGELYGEPVCDGDSCELKWDD